MPEYPADHRVPGDTMRGAPTGFPELNALLVDLTMPVQEILGDNFVGAYLQGSFAVGDADIHSDCDFLIPVNRLITPVQEAALRVLHDGLPTRPGHWTKHLEGSYPLRHELTSLDGLGARWLYIDHGWRQMRWSTHCNSEVARWSLRECGITLAGPDPKTLVDDVPADALRARMRRDIATVLPDMLEWITFDVAWAQRYAVTTFCRMLHTLEHRTGHLQEGSPKVAHDTLDPRWQHLVRQVLDDRRLGFAPDTRPRPGSVEATLEFADYAQSLARS